MSEGKIAKTWGVSCARTTLIAGLVFIVLVGVFVALAVLSISLPLQNDQRTFVWSGGLFLVIFVIALGALLLGIRSVKSHIQRVDDAFIPMGLTGKGYLWNGRQYHGVLHGRQIDAYFYRGPSLDIYLSSHLHTRLGVGLKGHFIPYLLPHQQSTPLAVNDPGFSNLAIIAQDDTWGRQLLDNPEARSIILRLAAEQPGLEFRNLLFQPEAIQFQLYHLNQGTLSPEALHQWLDDLFTLAMIAESLPSPQVTAVSSELERKARLSRSEFTSHAVIITLGVILFFTIIFISSLYIILSLTHSGL